MTGPGGWTPEGEGGEGSGLPPVGSPEFAQLFGQLMGSVMGSQLVQVAAKLAGDIYVAVIRSHGVSEKAREIAVEEAALLIDGVTRKLKQLNKEAHDRGEHES